MCPSILCRRMSYGPVEASALPLTWNCRALPNCETAIEELSPSPTYKICQMRWAVIGRGGHRQQALPESGARSRPECRRPSSRLPATTRRLSAPRTKRRAPARTVQPQQESTINTRSDCLRAHAGNQNHAERQSSDNRAACVGRIDARNRPCRVVITRSHSRQRQRKTRAPQQCRGQDGPNRAHQINLESEPRAGGKLRIDGPVRNRLGEHEGSPGNGRSEQQLAIADGCLRPHDTRQQGSPAAAVPNPTRNTAKIMENV